MLFTTTILALILAGAVQATPVVTPLTPTIDAVSAAPGVPVADLNLGSVSAHGNVTVGKDCVHASSSDFIDPATLFFCRSTGCGSCTGFDLSIQSHSTCLTPGFNFASVTINQPSNEGLPFAMYTGLLGCVSLTQVPLVNTSYNANYIGWNFELIP